MVMRSAPVLSGSYDSGYADTDPYYRAYLWYTGYDHYNFLCCDSSDTEDLYPVSDVP